MATKHIEHLITLPSARMLHFPVQLSQAGFVTTSDDISYAIPNHAHLEFCLRFSSEGEEYAVDELDGVKHYNTFPHLFIKHPKVFHRYHIKGIRQALFMIYPTDSIPRFAELGMELDQVSLPFVLTDQLAKLCGEYQALFPHSQEPGVPDRFDVLAYYILQEIFLQNMTSRVAADGTGNELHRISSYIHLHFNEPDILEKAVARFGYSYRTFLRHWQQNFKGQPAQYIEKLRMDEARRLLNNQRLQIQEIALRTGYPNASNFTQTFKRYFGTVPREYRKKLGSRIQQEANRKITTSRVRQPQP